MSALRRLPVLQNGSAPPPGELDRPAWHWTAIGALLIFSIWAPLTLAASFFVRLGLGGLFDAQSPDDVARWMASATAGQRFGFWALVIGVPSLVFALASLGGGALVGRFGAKAGPKEALFSGILAATAAWAIASFRGGLLSSVGTWVVMAAIGGLFGWAGGRLGYGKRSPGGL